MSRPKGVQNKKTLGRFARAKRGVNLDCIERWAAIANRWWIWRDKDGVIHREFCEDIKIGEVLQALKDVAPYLHKKLVPDTQIGSPEGSVIFVINEAQKPVE